MARYRRGPRNMLLHASIVALTAATTSLWLVRGQTAELERWSPNLDALAAAKPHVDLPRIQLAPPARPHVHLPHIQLPTRAPNPSAMDWLVLNEDPPSIAVSAPDVVPPAPAASQEAASPSDDATPPADDASADSGDAAPAQDQPAAAPPPSPAGARAVAVTTAYLRAQPTTDALITGTLPTGTVLSVVGCSAGCSWLLVQTAGGSQAWSASNWYSISGNTAGLPAH